MRQANATLSRVDPIAAAALAASLRRILSGRQLRVEFWDGTRSGSEDSEALVVRLHSPLALNRLLGALPERGFGRAFSEGLIDVAPIDAFLAAFVRVPRSQILAAAPGLLRAAARLGARPDLRRTAATEAALHGRRHTPRRDAAAVRHHYDLPERFFALWLDSTLTYSCAYFSSEADDLESAQRAKLDLICRKLRLSSGERVLDVGCGWGSFAIYAAEHYGVEVTGITLSPAQAAAARRRVAERGLGSRVTIRLADYRDALGESFDAVATIGMVEHVGRNQMATFARALRRAVRPGGRLLLHGIALPAGVRWARGSFSDAFIFPDGELQPISWRDGCMEHAGFELRDGESLREHYALTLQRWADRLTDRWDEAVALVGEERSRAWLLYLNGAKVGFQLGTVSVYQSLFVRPGAQGASFLPLGRRDWYQSGFAPTAQVRQPAAEESPRILIGATPRAGHGVPH